MRFFAIAALAMSLGSVAAWAQTRSDLIDVYLDDARTQPPLYQTAPVTHIVPALKTVTYALDARLLDVEVDNTNQGWANAPKETLKIEGYSVAPYVALSLKRTGLGFGVEAGRRSLAYQYLANNYRYQHDASVDYRGFSFHGFVKAIDTKVVTATVIGGLKNLSAKHAISQVYEQSPAAGDNVTYSLNGYDGGLNIGIRLIKPVTLIPWANYSYIDDAKARTIAKNHWMKQQTETTDMERDLEVFWHTQPELTYGLDIAAHLGNFEIHLGGLFGLIVASGGEHDERISDQSYSVSVSFSTKG